MNTEMLLQSADTEDLVRLSFFSDISKAIVSCNTVNEVLHEIMNQIGRVFAPFNWSLLLRNSKTGDLKFVIVSGQASENLKGKTVKRNQGIAGWIAENGLPLIIEDVEKDPRFDPSFDRNSGFKTESIIGVPLISKGKVYGVIELVNKLEGTKFTALDLKLLSTITDFAAIAIEKAYYLRSIKKLANIDPLTKVYNRRYFQFYLTKEIERTKRDGTSLSLLFIDIDDFKYINDTYGHPAGDNVLILVSEVINSCVRSSDVVFRFGGDEFMVLLPKTPSDKANILKERIVSKLEKETAACGSRVCVSIGCYEAKGEDYNSLLHFVDQDMYMQKLYNKEKEASELADNIGEEVGANN